MNALILERSSGDISGGRSALRRRPLTALAALFLVALALALPGNGPSRPLDTHEIFVARTATEMTRRDEWMVPWFNGVPRLQKPPLAYWLAMSAHALSGADRDTPVTEWEARSGSIVAGAILVIVTALLGWVAFGSFAVGLLGGALFATSQAYITWSHSAQPEMLYALFSNIELLGFVLAWRWRALARRALGGTILAWLGFVAAVFAKGPFLPVFVLAGVVLALVLARPRPGLLAIVRPLLGLGLVALCAVPYFALVVHREPHAIEFWLAQMFERTGGVSEAWWQPLKFYYVGQIVAMTAPWIVLLPATLLYVRRRPPAPVLMIGCATLVTIVCLSFSAGQKGHYLLPVMPLVCLLMAGAGVELAQRWSQDERKNRRVSAFLRAQVVLIALGAGAALAIIVAERSVRELPGNVVVASGVMLALTLMVCAASWRATRVRPARAAAWFVVGAALIMGAVIHSGIGWEVRRYTRADFARRAGHVVDHDKELIVIGGTSQLMLHYADCLVRPLEPDAARALLASSGPRMVVDFESRLESDGIRGEVLMREQSSPGEDPMVLIAADRIPSKSGPPMGTH